MTKRTVVITDRALSLLCASPGMPAAKSYLLWHLVKTLPLTGEHLSLTELAKVLNLSRVHVSNAMQDLLEMGFIHRGVKNGSLYHYQMNPAYFHTL